MEWNEVKAKPKRKTKKPQTDDGNYGGFSGGGFKAGPVQQTSSGPAKVATKQAQVIADYDPLGDEDEEIKYETVTHECAVAVSNARMKKEMSQA